MTDHPFRELLGPYVLGELSAEEERELERHLQGCRACRDELEEIRHTHGLLRETSIVPAPPPELKARVLERATNETQAHPGIRWKIWIPAAAALLAAAILGAGFLWSLAGDSSDSVPLTATGLAPGAGGEFRGEVEGENVQVELEVWNLPELQEGEYYEMWYYAEDGGRISCGTFSVEPEGRTTVNLTAPAMSAGRFPEVEITREPDDGDPRASGEEVLEGSLQDS